MPKVLAAILAACVFCAAPVAVLAQPAPAPAPAGKDAAPANVPSVTVTAKLPPKPKVIRRQSLNFVQSYAAPAPRSGHIARWRDPVCVQVVNLIPDQAAKVQARIEDVARAVGLKVTKPGCRSNIQIVFTDQPQQLLDAMARRNDVYLGFHHPSETQALKTVTRPVQAWYMTATRGWGDAAELADARCTDAAGDPAPVCNPPGMTNQAETIDRPGSPVPAGCGDSRFSDCLESVFKNVIVVADSRAMTGKDLGGVADYLAMLALSQPRSLDGCNALPSVIDLFAKTACPGRDAPDGLTPADAAYLTSLYGTDPEGRRASEVGDISSRMARILIKADAGKRP